MRFLVVVSLTAMAAALAAAVDDPRNPSVLVAQDTGRGSSVEVTGKWAAFKCPFFSYVMKLTQTGSTVTGCAIICNGTRTCPTPRITGTYAPPRIELTFTYADGPSRFYNGRVEGDSLMVGTLSGTVQKAFASVGTLSDWKTSLSLKRLGGRVAPKRRPR